MLKQRELYSMPIMEKNLKKVNKYMCIYIYVYIYMNNFAIYLKIIQHCKLTILPKIKSKLKQTKCSKN